MVIPTDFISNVLEKIVEESLWVSFWGEISESAWKIVSGTVEDGYTQPTENKWKGLQILSEHWAEK